MSFIPTYTGFTQKAALLRLRQLTNEPNYPDDNSAIGYLNDGLDQACDELDPVKQMVSILITAQSTTLTLPSLIQDIIKISYSTDLPTNPGVVEYETTELGIGGFMDATGQFPTTAGGPTVLWRRLADSCGSISIQVYPGPATGYLNVYYWERATPWDPQNPNSLTTVDQAYQYLAIWWAAARICETRENLRAKASYFQQLYDKMLATKVNKVRRRNQQRGSQVRDVVNTGASVSPAWFPN